MAKNMFINTTGLAIEKEIPSLMGMDLSGVAKKPEQLNIGKVITDFSDKAIAVDRQVQYTRIKNEMEDEYNKWSIDNLTDPNAFTNRDRRSSITKSYNDLIEKQKARLMTAKNGLGADQYAELEKGFKQRTYDSLYSIQNKMNTGYVQETLAGATLQANAIIMNCENTNDMNVINDNLNAMWQLYGALDSIGIDTRKMRADSFMTIQSNYMNRVIEDDIVNNFEDEKYAMIDPITKQPMRDGEGNLIMNNAKKMKAILETRKYMLSEDSIKKDAQEYSQKNNIPYNDAYNLIYNARDKFWKLRAGNYESTLASRDVQSEAKRVQREQKLNNAVKDRQNKLQDSISANDNVIDITRIAFNNNGLDYSNLYNPNIIDTLTDGQYNDIKNMYSNNMYFDMTNKNSITNIKNTYEAIDGPESADQFSELLKGEIYGVNNLYKDDKIYKDSKIASIQNRTGIPAGTIKYFTDDKLSDIAKEKELANKIVPNIDLSKVVTGFRGQDSPFSNNATDSIWVQPTLKMILANPEKYLLGKQSSRFNSQSTQDKLSDILSLYNKDKAVRSTIDNLVGHNRNMARRNLMTQYRPNGETGSKLYQATELYTAENYRLENLDTFKKDPDIVTNVIQRSSGNVDRVNEIGGLVDSKYQMFLNGEYTMGTEERLDVLQNPYYRQKFTPEVIKRVENGTLNIYDIPLNFIENNKEMEDYFAKIYEVKRNSRENR